MTQQDRIENVVIVVVIGFVVMLTVSAQLARGDESTYWRARVNAALAVQQAESNPWYPSTPPIKPEAPANAKVDERPIVYRLTAKWCGPCRDVERRLTAEVRAKLPFQVVDWDVDTKGWMGSPTIPAAWWKSPKGNLRCTWTTVENVVATWKASQAAKSAGKAVADQYTPRWSYPGDLASHLQTVHGVSEAATLTQDQREALHDALHEGHSLSAIKRYAVKHGLIK